MSNEDITPALTFAEALRRARVAGASECPRYDLHRGLHELLSWMDRHVETVPDDAGAEDPPPSGRRMTLDVAALSETQKPLVALRGRATLLEELSVLARRPERGPVVLTGVGGAGKSTVAAALAHRVRAWGRPVWWVSASDPGSLCVGLAGVARELGGSARDIEAIGQGGADAVQRCWRLLERAPQQWLLVLDNADDPWVLSVEDSPAGVQDGTGWVRPSRHGLVLVTSRESDPRIWAAARLRHVGRLREADAALVLCDLAPTAGDQAQARVLARRLDRLPLALHLAGSYLCSEAAQWSTFGSYARALDSSAAPAPRWTTVTRTAELSLDALARGGLPQARTVLRLASCYAPTTIPMGMFDAEATAALFGRMASTSSPRQLVEKAVHGLRSVGLIDSPAIGPTAISVHPEVTAANRACLDRPEPDADLIRRTAIDLLATATRSLRFDLPQGWPVYRMLGQHLLALLNSTAEHVDPPHLALLLQATADIVSAISRSGAGHAGRTLCQVALHRCAALGHDNPDTLLVRHHLAWLIADQGDFAEAEAMYRDVLQTRLRVLPAHDPELLDSRHELAWISACQGRWSQAESRYRQTLHDSLRILGPDNPRTLQTRHELAWAIANQDRLDEARTAFHQVLRDLLRVLGSDHPRTLATSHELAWITAAQGHWTQAEARYRHLLQRRQQILDDDHPETLLTAHELAWTIARQGRRLEATTLYEHVLASRRRTLGDDHPDTQTTLRALDELCHGRIIDARHLA